MFRRIAVIATVLCVGVAAHATVYDFGPHDGAEASFAIPGAGYVPPGAFQDAYMFDLLASVTLTSTVSALTQTGILGLTGGNYFIYAAGANNSFGDLDDFTVAQTGHAFDGTTGQTPHSVVLGAGKYAYIINGTATDFGAYYALVSSVSAVPEPETLGLMLAGVGLLGFLAKRRAY